MLMFDFGFRYNDTYYIASTLIKKNVELKMPPLAVMKHYYIKLCSKIAFVI